MNDNSAILQQWSTYEIAEQRVKSLTGMRDDELAQAKLRIEEQVRNKYQPTLDILQQTRDAAYGQLDALTAGEEKIDLGGGRVFNRKPHDPSKKTSYVFGSTPTVTEIEKNPSKYDLLSHYIVTIETRKLSPHYKDDVASGKLHVVGSKVVNEDGVIVEGLTAEIKPDELVVKGANHGTIK